MQETTLLVAAIATVAILAPALWWLLVRRASRRTIAQARRQAARILEEADRERQAKLREAKLQAKEKLLHAKGEFEKASRQRRSEIESQERRLAEREETLDKRQDEILVREREASAREKSLAEWEKRLEKKESQYDELIAEERSKLEHIAGLTAHQAKDDLMRLMENEARMEAAHLVKRIEDEAREKGEREAQKIIGTAIQRSAQDYVAETTVSVVMLPSDDMKGRIIGREGRNIRTLEMATGVDLIVDDTPEAVILSGFDPYRREIAKVALERLIADGRIHPARVEQIVEKVKAEFEQQVRKEGEGALLELNLTNVAPELVSLLGRLRYRMSYGQNVLHHSKEVAFLASIMAAELKADIEVAKRAGLFHDIGKAVDREVEGTHLEIGIDLLRRHGESEEVIHAMACHHGDYDPQSVEAILVSAADALSGARPGARREALESYVKRLEKLEAVASSFSGVRKVYAIQAGREIRVIVDSDRLSDEEALWLSKDVAKKIQEELTYPGHIKVTVIREMRAVEFAK